LHANEVTNGAVLIVDHLSNEVLAWVNGGNLSEDWPGSRLDGVTTPRQPGSALKPFLYALALEKGWTAATLIDDSPLAMPVGSGLHSYRNYSRVHYGSVRLRVALGNSLNIPAVRTAQFIGPANFLERLTRLGFRSLSQHPDYYGDGLALGNGEVTLLELVQAYASLARQGVFRPLETVLHAPEETPRRVFSEEVSTLIANILSDPEARRLEFGHGNLLRFPVQTAVKTGISAAWDAGG
jgi:penicillin-binding protein 1C